MAKSSSITSELKKKKKKKVTEKLEALLEAESKKKNSHRILLAVQSMDTTREESKEDRPFLDFRQAAGSDGISGNITTEDPYFIASQTKLMTSTVIFQLVDEGMIPSLNEPISEYLPLEMIDKIHVYKGKDYSSGITIKELLHQTSGLPDFFMEKDKKTGKSVQQCLVAGEDADWVCQDYLDMAKQMKPKFVPSASNGTKSFYSDTNFQLLGAIIKTITSKSIQENFDTRIFTPLGLSKNTYSYNINANNNNDDESRRQEPMRMYYKEKEIHIPKVMSSFEADGGVVSTLDDMLVFLRAYFDGNLFHKDHLVEIQKQWNTVLAPPIQYGLGLMRFKVPKWMTFYLMDLPPLYGHSGSNASFTFYAPHKNVLIAGTFNQNDQESRPFQFMMQVLNCLD